MPWRSFLSLKKSLPGPWVGNADIEQVIFPPVVANAAWTALRAGKRAGSGILLWEKRFGSFFRRLITTDLDDLAWIQK